MQTHVVHSHDVHPDGDYRLWLSNLISRYRRSQVKAAVKVNSEKLFWNWQMGRDLVELKAESRWGSGIVDQVSLDLQAAFPGERGFGSSNIWYMKKWYLFYTGADAYEKLQQAVGETEYPDNRQVAKLHQLGGEIQDMHDEFPFPAIFAYIPWGHHIEIITKCKTIAEAAFYMRLVVKESLSRSALTNCLKANLYQSHGSALTNYDETLPLPQAKLAQELTKSNYDFSFVTLPVEYDERQLEDALCKQMTRFLLELGNGFAFMGKQKELVVGGVSRRIDLLFYHIRLRSYIVLEIKTKAFDPSYAGQINFYVNAVDMLLKEKDDNPTIGILICSDMRKTDVQLSFQGITTPLGVATYDNIQLEEIKKQLPTYEQLAERVRLLENELLGPSEGSYGI